MNTNPNPTLWPPSAHPQRDVSWAAMEPVATGTFLTVEGLDLTGKSTLVKNLLSRLERTGREIVLTREPGGPPRNEGEPLTVAQLSRQVLLEPETLGIQESMPYEASLAIFVAGRFAHVSSTVLPALRRGAIVLCDRFYGSTFAFQGYGLRLFERHGLLARDFYLSACAMLPRQPDGFVFLTAPADVLDARRKERHGEQNHVDRMGAEFHARVRAGYERFFALDGSPPEDGLEFVPERLIVADGTMERLSLADHVAAELARFL